MEEEKKEQRDWDRYIRINIFIDILAIKICTQTEGADWQQSGALSKKELLTLLPIPFFYPFSIDIHNLNQTFDFKATCPKK